MTASLGTLPLDLPKLLETRMLVQANSGAGKSWALRRVLEQTAPHVQQLVIDPEGEFASLREKFDYIVCAPHGADAVANPSTAAALARALWESGASAILDIYDLKAHERVLFVRRFCEALVNAPKAIWHPTLVVIDEVHIFAPQVGQAESLGAVVDLATRGRKRGLAMLGATQRLSKLHKDVAAELLNKMIGRTGLDVDVKRAADELGMTSADARVLRDLDPGEWFVYGPALTRSVTRTKIGAVLTTHPKTGARGMLAPPPASAKVLARLQKIEGLQRQAEDEVKTVATLTAQVTDLKRKLTMAEKAQGGIAEPEVQRRIKQAIAEAAASTPSVAGERLASQRELERLTVPLAKIRDLALQALGEGFAAMVREPAAPSPTRRAPVSTPAPAPATSVAGLRSGAVRILQELAARAPAGYSRPQVGALTKFSHKGGTFGTYFSDLRRAGFIEERGGLVYATDAGVQSLGGNVRATPKTHDEVMAMWRGALRSGAFSMLQAIVDAGPRGIGRDDIAAAVGMSAAGGTFGTYLSDLRRNGLITEHDKRCTANDILFPDARARK